MSEIGRFVDGYTFLRSSPFRSAYFLVASMLGLAAVIFDAWLIWRHWKTTPADAILVLSILIGLQMLYQWWRALRYRNKIRNVCANSPVGATTRGMSSELALRIAVGGMIDILFFSYGIALLELILIGWLFLHANIP